MQRSDGSIARKIYAILLMVVILRLRKGLTKVC